MTRILKDFNVIINTQNTLIKRFQIKAWEYIKDHKILLNQHFVAFPMKIIYTRF